RFPCRLRKLQSKPFLRAQAPALACLPPERGVYYRGSIYSSACPSVALANSCIRDLKMVFGQGAPCEPRHSDANFFGCTRHWSRKEMKSCGDSGHRFLGWRVPLQDIEPHQKPALSAAACC